ncbi:MAG: cytochrome b/b6 domain-containing protein [Pseudomonadota bacterium]
MASAQPASPFGADPAIRVWDLPVRLTHWSFALLVPALWWSAENSQWALHKRFGVTLLGLLIFRVVWGFIGTRTARFSSFVKSPGAVLAYLKGKGAAFIGHSPLAGLSVVALLGAMAIQVGAGLFSGDPYDGATGPLNPLVKVSTADALTNWHEWFYWVVLGLVALHLTAIVYYLAAKQDDLVSPMVSGRKIVKADVQENEPAPWGRFAFAAALSAGLALWVAFGVPPFT